MELEGVYLRSRQQTFRLVISFNFKGPSTPGLHNDSPICCPIKVVFNYLYGAELSQNFHFHLQKDIFRGGQKGSDSSIINRKEGSDSSAPRGKLRGELAGAGRESSPDLRGARIVLVKTPAGILTLHPSLPPPHAFRTASLLKKMRVG